MGCKTLRLARAEREGVIFCINIFKIMGNFAEAPTLPLPPHPALCK